MSLQRTEYSEIVPDNFLDAHNAETVEEALKKARSAQSTTPESERKRCPRCKSIDIKPKSDQITSNSQRKDGNYHCHSCRSHFEKPLPPLAEIDEEGDR